jgi:hypothetical protein
MTAIPYQNGPDFHDLRGPREAWHHGEAMVTTNRQTDGRTTPGEEDFGADDDCDDEPPKTLESRWDLLGSGGGDKRHVMRVACRGRGDMNIWADGRLDPPPAAERHGSSGSGASCSGRTTGARELHRPRPSVQVLSSEEVPRVLSASASWPAAS